MWKKKIFGQKSKFWAKKKISVKNQNCVQINKFPSKIIMLAKKQILAKEKKYKVYKTEYEI